MAQKIYFACIVKTDAIRFLRLYKVTNWKKLYIWLDANKKGWRWGNVYYRRKQIGNFTNKNRPNDFYL
jgi:hypothetical protein